MNKGVWIILVILVGWTVKLSLDVYELNGKHLTALNGAIDQQNQRIGTLNDQLVALQQKQISSMDMVGNLNAENTQQAVQQASQQQETQLKKLIHDRLQLTQLAVEQQQFNLALEYIQETRQQLQHSVLGSDSLNQALMTALSTDQAAIVNYLQQRNEHLQILQQQLKTLNTLLVPSPLDQQQDKWDITNWFSIKRHSDVPDLSQRNLNYKQIQLNVLLAEQALLAGQTEFYQQQMNEILTQVAAYPDLAAQRSIEQLHKIKQTNLGGVPQVSALTLLRDAR